jgi:hypothetical protein
MQSCFLNFKIGDFTMTDFDFNDADQIRKFVDDRLGCGTDLAQGFYDGAFGALKHGDPRFVIPVHQAARHSADAGKGHADAAHAVYVDGLANAWRTPSVVPSIATGASQGRQTVDSDTTREDARADYESRLRDAWRG